MFKKIVGVMYAGLFLLAAACSHEAVVSPTEVQAAAVAPQKTNTASPQPFPTDKIRPTTLPTTASVTAAPAFTQTPSPTAALCSPLENIPLEELGQPDLMKNPFQAPRPGMDDGHPGTDFAYWSRGERKEMLGHPVLAVLPGTVAGLVQNRPPYGYAVILETPLDVLPQAWIDRLLLPTPAPTVQPAPNLFCPPVPAGSDLPEERSLYLLYAHLNLPPDLSIGQPVGCGQAIGEVGTTGRSVNPHLHLETRVGPTGARFTELAHYDNGASENEMRNYCTWRVSGLFYPLDPLAIIQSLSLQP